METVNFVPAKTLTVPQYVTSLAFGHAGHFFVGSDDGSLRVYDLSTYKVLKAVKSLGSEISSIVCVKRSGTELRDAWLAHGHQISRFQMDSPALIQSLENAVETIDIGDESDVLNELSLNADKTHVAFSLDSGVVGVVDLATQAITKMETGHESICGSVKFIPDRPREFVSGGYDMHLLHYDFVQKKELSRYKLESVAAPGGMSLAPPFVMSVAVSSSGILAAGSADGNLLIALGGEKKSGPVKKKTKSWNGLDTTQCQIEKVAEGPIVALSFSDARTLTLTTLLGKVVRYSLEENGLREVWKGESKILEKANSLIADDKRIILGGFSKDGKGVVVIWKQELATSPA